jgi:hypothetical protein
VTVTSTPARETTTETTTATVTETKKAEPEQIKMVGRKRG